MSLSRFRGRIAAAVVVTAFALVISTSSAYAALTETQISAVLSLLNSFGVDASTVSTVEAALRGQPAPSAPAPTGDCGFTRSLFLGVSGSDVLCLQQYLNGAGHTLASSGAGSPGSETQFYGPLTRDAVARWQAANSVAPAVGYFGPISRAKYSSLLAAAPPADEEDEVADEEEVTPAGTGLTVAKAATQPVATIAPQSAARVPFTKFTLTASSDGDITVKSITVQRVGLMADTTFGGIVLIDEDGTQIGLERTLNSVHQSVLSSEFTVPKGTTKTYSIAGNMAADLSQETGQVGGLDIIAIDAGSATVSGSLPISGTQHTANSSLTIGVLTVALGTNDPGSANASLEVGRTAYIAAGLQFTVGSAEDVQLESIRWNQAGSASKDDLANAVMNIDGTDYPTTATEDGKYFRATLATPLKMIKGAVIQLYVKSDIASGSGRTVDFNMDRKTDIVVKGLSFGHYLTPTGGSSGSASAGALSSDTQPFFNAYAHTISNGTITVSKAVTVPAQNIAINLSGQPLGGMSVEVKGEPINVSAINFDVAFNESAYLVADTADITSITLEDSNGNVVAGPVDGVAGNNNAVRFTDTITFPVGTNVYTLKGKIGTDLVSNDTIAASTTPSSDWTSKGQVTGNDITESPTTAVTLSTMTIKGADLRVSIDTVPVAQNMVAGAKNFHFANVVLDATASGEDVRITTIKPALTIATANTGDDLSGCQLFDGSTAVNTGSNAVDVGNSVASDADVTFTIDSPGVTVAKGTVKSLALKCNVRANPDGTAGTSTYAWGLNNTAGNVVSTGLTSAQAITETLVAATGQAMTIQSGGSLAVALDSSSPALKLVQAGATDQTLLVLRVNATNEGVRLDRIGLQLATSTDANVAMASNTPADLPKVTLWNGSTQVGEAVFSNSDYATSTFSTSVVVPKDGQILLAIKGDIGTQIGTTLNSSPGHLALVNYDASSADDEANLGLKGVGQESGTTIYAGGSDTASNGGRIVKTTPTVSKISLTSSEAKLTDGSQKTLYKFSVSAPSGSHGISLYKFTFDVATATQNFADTTSNKNLSTFRVTSFEVYCYSDSAMTLGACGAFDTSGRLNQGGLAKSTVEEDDNSSESGLNIAANTVPTALDITFNPADSTGGSTAEAVVVPAGETRYFALKASITGSATTSPSVTTSMLGDATFASLNNAAQIVGSTDVMDRDLTTDGDSYSTGRYIFATTASRVDNWDDDDFIWSPNSTNTSMSINTYDWFNGFLVPGLPTSQTVSEVLVP